MLLADGESIVTGSELQSQLGALHPNNSYSPPNFTRDQSDTVHNLQEARQVEERFSLPRIIPNPSFMQRILGDSAGRQAPRDSEPTMPSHRIEPNTSTSPPMPRELHQSHSAQFLAGQSATTDVDMYSHMNEATRNAPLQRRRPGANGSARSCASILKDKTLRRKLLTVVVSSIFLLLTVSIYLAFAITHTLWGSEVHILLIFMILILAIVSCHSLILFVMALFQQPASNRIPSMVGPAGYAQPTRPIPVTFESDEEMGAESHGIVREKVTVPPPAYGLWRSSVRLNPDLLYWQRVDNHACASTSVMRAEGSHGKPQMPRPPSYISDDGVDYVVEAQPRSFTQFCISEDRSRR